ncbi:MAG: SdpI family protein [Polaribacter sp.]|nr:SdpI family protein [Polaribacter sp.]MDG1811796.1 SdpI family protein [Polaribacter sp.]MDG1994659.1 SdpI family protein [Polaribacter sp.]
MDPYIYVISVNGLLLFFSVVFYFFPPKKINSFYGYRTNKSMKNEEIWHFANSFFNNTLVKYASISFAVALLFVFITAVDVTWQPMVFLLLTLAVAVFKTEQKLSENFDSDGNKIKSKK